MAALIGKFTQWNHFQSADPSYETHRTSNRRTEKLAARLAAIEKRLGIPAADAPRVAATHLDGRTPPEYPRDFQPSVATPGFRPDDLQLEVIDPPGPAVKIYPDAVRFAAIGSAAGLFTAVVVASFGRRSDAAHSMEQPA